MEESPQIIALNHILIAADFHAQLRIFMLQFCCTELAANRLIIGNLLLQTGDLRLEFCNQFVCRIQCSISFDGKSMAEFNADMCLFLEQWEDERSELRAYNSTQAAYKRWKEQTLAYYAANAVRCTEPEELDRDERIARRTELLEKEYGKNESNE